MIVPYGSTILSSCLACAFVSFDWILYALNLCQAISGGCCKLTEGPWDWRHVSHNQDLSWPGTWGTTYTWHVISSSRVQLREALLVAVTHFHVPLNIKWSLLLNNWSHQWRDQFSCMSSFRMNMICARLTITGLGVHRWIQRIEGSWGRGKKAPQDRLSLDWNLHVAEKVP